jgi:hypothetical protein
MHVSNKIMSEPVHFLLIGIVRGMQNWGGGASAGLNYTLLVSVIGQARSTFRVMRATYAESGLRAGDVKFNTHNEELINTV